MIRSAASKVMWVGRATVFLVGLAVILALTVGAVSRATAHTGSAGLFHLGHSNPVATLSTLAGNVATGVLNVSNTSTASTATAVGAANKSAVSPTVRATNSGGGPALGLSVGSGKAPMTVNATAGKATNLDADKVDGKTSSDFAPAYKRTVVVSPVGTAAQNGTALKNALAGITDVSATIPHLIKIEPGVYDLGAAPGLQMKSFVDIEGSGEGVTTLTASGSSSFTTGSVVGASNSELRSLTVKNTGGLGYANAVFYQSDDMAGSFRLTHVTGAASGGTTTSGGVEISAGRVVLNQTTAGASGTSTNMGVSHSTYIGKSSHVTLSQVTASASGGTNDWGFFKNSDYNTEIRDSLIVGSTNTVRNAGGTGAIRVGNSQLSGGPAEDATCAGVYDENYAFYASTCP